MWLVLTWVFFFGTIIVIPFGFNDVGMVAWQAFGLVHWGALIFVIFFTTFLAYLLNTLSLKELSPAVMSYYIYLQPIFATGISLAIHHEPLRWVHLISCLMIFTGVYLLPKPTLSKRIPKISLFLNPDHDRSMTGSVLLLSILSKAVTVRSICQQ